MSGHGITNGKAQSKTGLASLISEYKRVFQPRLRKGLAFYANQKSIREAIELATLAKNVKGKMNSHQRRVGKAVLRRAAIKLLENEKNIKNCRSFHELIHLVEQATANVERFGELAVYDTSLRIAAKLGCWPEKVYLHAGTRKGAKFFGLDTTNGVVDKKDLPPALRKLKMHEVEDFLCIYKDGKLRKVDDQQCSPGLGGIC